MARKTGPAYQMTHTHRDKIKNSNILNALIEHAEGKRDMSSSQVTAGLGLLDRIMPKLATTQVNGSGENGEHVVAHEIVLRAVKANDNSAD